MAKFTVYDFNGKKISIPNTELDRLVDALGISQDEAIECWLADNDYTDNEEVEELTAKAKKNKVGTGAAKGNHHKNSKPRTVKISDEKQELFNFLKEKLAKFAENNAETLTVLKENKLFSLTIGDKTFKIDVIEQRKPKEKAQ